MRRKVVPERLDSDAGTAREVQDSLRDLELINTLFGGATSTAKLVRQIARDTGRKSFTLLEVASGNGFVPRRANDWLSSDGIRLDISLLDRARTHLPVNGLPTYVGDALSLPFADHSFDLVSCGLFLHHLDPQQAHTFARESLRVARCALLISDLIRSRLHWLLAHLSLPLYVSPITWHDSLASIHAAYTPQEVRELFRESGAARVQIENHYLYRMGVILWK